MFSESMKIELKLRINDNVVDIPCGNIKAFDLHLSTFGFKGKVSFGLFSDDTPDPLLPLFITPDLINVGLSLIRVYNLRGKKTAPIKLEGVVTEKSVRESRYSEVETEPVLERNYEISFQDIPAVLWKQHYPVKLYTEKTISDVLLDQVVGDIRLEVDEAISEETEDMVFLGLGESHLKASFYDFFMWYVQAKNITLVYDYTLAGLKLLADKPSGTPDNVLLPGEVAGIHTFFSESVRHQTRILNVHSEEPEEIEILNDQAIEGITRDIVMRTAIHKALDDRKTLETSKLKIGLEKIEMEMKEFPSMTCTVGTMVKFEEKNWRSNTLLSEKNFRVFEIQISGAAKETDLSEHYNADHGVFNIEMLIGLEHEDNPEVYLPPFKNPDYPVLVEGKILSEPGEDTDKTYQFNEDEKTSLESYSVHVPHWDLTVKAPFIPDVFTGHFYFPAFKHSRVLLALYLTRARIRGFLDWGEGAKLPLDTQGNHILFGKNKLDETSMKYHYSEDKPVFTIKRTLDTDTEIIRMEDESIILETKDEE